MKWLRFHHKMSDDLDNVHQSLGNSMESLDQKYSGALSSLDQKLSNIDDKNRLEVISLQEQLKDVKLRLDAIESIMSRIGTASASRGTTKVRSVTCR